MHNLDKKKKKQQNTFEQLSFKMKYLMVQLDYETHFSFLFEIIYRLKCLTAPKYSRSTF